MQELAVYVIAFALGLACIAYPDMARGRGWTMGELYSGDGSWLQILAFVSMGWSLVESFLALNWWTPLVVLVVGFAVSFALTMLLRSLTQVICLVGVPVSFLLVLMQ